MRITVVGRRLLIALGAAVILLCGLIVSQAAYAAPGAVGNLSLAPGSLATPARPTSEEQVPTRTEAEESLDPLAISFYMNKHAVSEGEARYRLATQLMAPDVAASMHGVIGSAFAQAWFNNSNGDWVIAATSAASASAAREAFERDGLGGLYELKRVDYDEQQLQEVDKDVSSELAAKLPPGGYTVGIRPGEVHVALASGQSTSAAQEAAAAVHAQVSAASPTGAASGPPIDIEQTQQASLAASPTGTVISKGAISCTDTAGRWCNAIVGGDQWQGSDSLKPGKGFACSTGFLVKSSGDVNPLFLTAGHCDVLAGNYGAMETCDPGETKCGEYGHQIPYYYYGNGDAGLVEDDQFPIYGGYWNWSVSTVSTVEFYASGGGGWDKTVVCLNGERDGSSCGEIVEEDGSVSYPEDALGLPPVSVTAMLVVSGACDEPGDSGG